MPMKVTYTVVNGEILSENRNGVKRDYIPDPQGNVVGLIDENQTITDTFKYWPYGEVRARTGTTPTRFQYVGTAGYYQTGPSRCYVRARTLDVGHGQWITEDPLRFRIPGVSEYSYCEGRPITDTDPFGLLAAQPKSAKELRACCAEWAALVKKLREIWSRPRSEVKLCAEACGPMSAYFASVPQACLPGLKAHTDFCKTMNFFWESCPGADADRKHGRKWAAWAKGCGADKNMPPARLCP